ncbi:DJ-1/PfpI family protein [Parvibaculum sedimenti]|uniref:DJ-1/PfpI family protein n=1 Tax=Parvibaculum sedimenti TaxID=2608632 RepID=A0A6N6VN87_9HYPH|nr:DJ-1/PfpI family protein [Parvibaculum sedimenti]KAB7741218.1 DJ-1/PfpI family protein [Parvibaculum sedimenti]
MSRERTIGILIFDDAEELDFVGPYEVFTMSNEMFARSENRRPDKVLLISETGRTVTCAKGMRVEPHAAIGDIDRLDLLLVPGGQGTRVEVNNKAITDWVARIAGTCEWVTSVCTGSLVLTAAGPAKGKRMTTHWAFIPTLRERGEAAEVLERVRYVRDGNVVTSAGVSAGIDMALWLVGQMHGEDHARATQLGMQYDPAPPYAAAV